MTTEIGNGQTQPPAPKEQKELSAQGLAAQKWFRLLGRTLKICHLYKPEYPVVVQARDALFAAIDRALGDHGTWRFRITPTEFFLGEEAVVRPSERGPGDDSLRGKEEALPFVFYRDGIRALTLMQGLPRRDLDALVDALIAAGDGLVTHDDLVTLFWQANATHVKIDAVPLEQTIYLSSRKPGATRGGGGRPGQSYAWSPAGGEIRADLGQATGVAQGLHRDTFDDWEMPEGTTDVVAAYQALLPKMEFSRLRLSTEWVGERSTDWTLQAPDVMREILALSPGTRTQTVLSRAVATWLVDAMQRTSWVEAQGALKLLREFDPDGSLSKDDLAAGLAGLDTDDITERLDEAEPDEQATFFALSVGLGTPAVALGCDVMSKATKNRTRAAACNMLCYLCSDQPQLLAPYLDDSRWFVARNVAFVLGQIGGPEVADLLALAAEYPEPRVLRQVVASLGSVPREKRSDILIAQLGTFDPQLLASSLSMLSRERNPETAKAILFQIEAPEFENRSEDIQRTLFNALAEVADDSAVPVLETILNKGGWFARRTLQRTAAARTLQRLGTEKALAALTAGLRSRSEAVRTACQEAMAVRKAA